MSEPQQAGTEGEPHVAPWAERRRSNRNIIRANGVDWDQPRSIDMNAGCGFDAIAAGMRQRVQTYADIAPAFLDREVPGAAACPGHDHPGWFHLPPAHRGGPVSPACTGSRSCLWLPTATAGWRWAKVGRLGAARERMGIVEEQLRHHRWPI